MDLEFEDGDLIAAFIIEDRRREESLTRKERRHNYSLERTLYEDEKYFSSLHNPENSLIAKEEYGEIEQRISKLTETQQRRLKMRLQGMSSREIARIENVSEQRISATLKQIRKKLF